MLGTISCARDWDLELRCEAGNSETEKQVLSYVRRDVARETEKQE